MPEKKLRGRRVLLVEDDFFLADGLEHELREAGAIVVGPAGSVEEALQLIASEPLIEAGILDINLHGEPSFPVADSLIERNVPFVFTTGYDTSVIPRRFSHVVRCEKPVALKRIARAVGRAIPGAEPGSGCGC